MILYRYKMKHMETEVYVNCTYVVVETVPEITFFFDKYKTVEIFKLHFLRSIPPVQLYTSTSDCTFGLGNISGSHFVKAFSALPSHS